MSLFHAANLNKVLAVERKHLGPDAKFNSFVIYPGYLSLTQVTGGSTSDVYINANGQDRTVSERVAQQIYVQKQTPNTDRREQSA